MDRPGLSFFGSGGEIGMPSPVRAYLPAFKDAGVPVFVHNALRNPLDAVALEPKIAADINDLEFIKRFQLGLKNDPKFFEAHLSENVVASLGDKVVALLSSIDLSATLASTGGIYGTPEDLYRDLSVRPFLGSSPLEVAKTLLFFVVACSAKMNFAFNVGAKEGFFPFADARPYGELLKAKYLRAVNHPNLSGSKIQPGDLTIAALEEAFPPESLEALTIPMAIDIRKKYQGERAEFLECIAALQSKLGEVKTGRDYQDKLREVVISEVRPAINTFRNKIRTIDEKAANAIGTTAALTLVSVFAGLSWPAVLTAGLIPIAKSVLDTRADERAARRECSMSYILRLD